MASFIRPIVIDEDPAPPWNWNPVATFQTAFNDAQANQRAQEKMAMERELMGILLPQKKAETEFNLKKLAYQSKLLENEYRAGSAEIDQRYRIAASGSSSGGGTSGATTQSNKGFESQYGFGLKFKTPTQAAPTSKPTWRVVTPAQPQPGP